MPHHPDHDCKGTSPAARPGEGPGQEAIEDPARAGSVRSIVLLSPRRYDAGPLISELNLRYSKAEIDFVPVLTNVSSVEDAVNEVRSGQADLLLVRDPVSGPDPGAFADRIEEVSPGTAVAIIVSDPAGCATVDAGSRDPRSLGPFLVKDTKMIPRIVQVLEDAIYPGRGDLDGISPHVVLISVDDPDVRSAVLNTAADIIWEHLCHLTGALSSAGERIRTFLRRPRILFGEGLDKIRETVKRSGERISLLITDGKETEGSIQAERVFTMSGKDPGIPKEVVERSIGAGSLVMVFENGKHLDPVHDLRSLDTAMEDFPEGKIDEKLYEGSIRPWLIGRTEFELVRELDRLFTDGGGEISVEAGRSAISGSMSPSGKRGVKEFSRELFQNEDFSRIGGGQLGGKGRGLAFLGKLLDEIDQDAYKGLNVRIPRTVVLATDVFDLFLKINGSDLKSLSDLDDERIVDLFLRSDLPSTVTGDIRHFVSTVRSPVIVRSSSLLEDALLQPFAGIYASVMLSNSSIELDNRFKHICMAIKYVYSSTFHARARSYIGSTGSPGSEEKMAVIIQEVVGQKHGELYYPSFSGVARSFDYWPFFCCSSSDGTVNLAVGLGKMIVDGGSSHKFCPRHPKASFTGSPSESIRQSQRHFYALKKGSTLISNEFSEDIQMVKEEIPVAEKDGVLDPLASTYVFESDRLYPGIGRDGPRVIDFAPILQMGTIPLASFLDELLTRSEKALGTHVEIEFAVNIDPDDERKADLYLLQLRGMRGRSSVSSVDMADIDENTIIARSGRTLGDGMFNLGDVIMVKGNTLEAGTADALVREIGRLNSSLVKEGRSYMLLGPGRWGSCDPWLGIPVSWNDISGVGVISERPVGDRSIDPSQGSHFFQNISSFQLGFLTFSPSEDTAADWDRLVRVSKVEEGKNIIHIMPDPPIRIVIDGSRGKGLIQLPAGPEGSDGPNQCN